MNPLHGCRTAVAPLPFPRFFKLYRWFIVSEAPLTFLGTSAPTLPKTTRGDVAVYGRHGKRRRIARIEQRQNFQIGVLRPAFVFEPMLRRGSGGPRPKKVPHDIDYVYVPYKRQGKKMALRSALLPSFSSLASLAFVDVF